MEALIVYHSKTGHTEQAARDIARGLESDSVGCVLRSGADLTAATGKEDMDRFGIILVGTPTYGNRRYRLPAKPVEQFLDSLGASGLKGKTCGAFAVNARVGGDRLVTAMERRLIELGGNVVFGGPVIRAGAPLSLWKGPDASTVDVKTCEEFGRKVASSVSTSA